jgi:hypothetical protein
MATARKKTVSRNSGGGATKAKARIRPAAKAGGRSAKLPLYNQLPVRHDAPKGAAWGVFGDSDEVGTVNLMTAQCVVKAAAEIRHGRVFPLNLPINIPDPPIYGRGAYRHHLFPLPRSGLFHRRLPRQFLSPGLFSVGRGRPY